MQNDTQTSKSYYANIFVLTGRIVLQLITVAIALALLLLINQTSVGTAERVFIMACAGITLLVFAQVLLAHLWLFGRALFHRPILVLTDKEFRNYSSWLSPRKVFAWSELAAANLENATSYRTGFPVKLKALKIRLSNPLAFKAQYGRFKRQFFSATGVYRRSENNGTFLYIAPRIINAPAEALLSDIQSHLPAAPLRPAALVAQPRVQPEVPVNPVDSSASLAVPAQAVTQSDRYNKMATYICDFIKAENGSCPISVATIQAIVEREDYLVNNDPQFKGDPDGAFFKAAETSGLDDNTLEDIRGAEIDYWQTTKD